LTFQNPEWLEKKKAGRWLGKTQEYLKFFQTTPEGLIIPRGYFQHLINVCKELSVKYETIDNRISLPGVDFTFNGSLKPYQEKSLEEINKYDFGVLESPTGSGKTIIALKAIADRQQPALIVVHTKELVDQWADRIETFLGIPQKEIGIIGAGQCNVGLRINAVFLAVNKKKQ
jgi:superfamily II DNA or RNA helicase